MQTIGRFLLFFKITITKVHLLEYYRNTYILCLKVHQNRISLIDKCQTKLDIIYTILYDSSPYNKYRNIEDRKEEPAKVQYSPHAESILSFWEFKIC